MTISLGDKVEDLQRTGAILVERVDNTLKLLDDLYDDHNDLARELADLRRQYEREIALLKREVEDFKKWKDDQKREREELSRRLWAFGPNAFGAVLSGLIAAAVAYFISRR